MTDVINTKHEVSFGDNQQAKGVELEAAEYDERTELRVAETIFEPKRNPTPGPALVSEARNRLLQLYQALKLREESLSTLLYHLRTGKILKLQDLEDLLVLANAEKDPNLPFELCERLVDTTLPSLLGVILTTLLVPKLLSSQPCQD